MDILTVTELNQQARDLLETQFGYFWLKGEISNFSSPSSGHWYFSLKDPNSQIRAAFFKNNQRKLNFQPKEGIEVLVQARLSLYVPRGDYQIIVENMQLSGDGLLRRQFEQLKIKLLAEGLFEETHKKSLPLYPHHIAVITSASGAALRDILHVLDRRASIISIDILPVAVQGKTSAQEIVAAIQKANFKAYDLIVLARGGGALEDLQSFNEEIVARAIFASQLPIITGIGHQTDFTIADFIADVRAPTPSAAAELLSAGWVNCKNQLIATKKQLIKQITHLLSEYQQKFFYLSRHLKHPRRAIKENYQRHNEYQRRLILAQQQLLQKNQQYWSHLRHRLHMMSPLATLERGYAMAFNIQHQLIREAKQTKIGEKLQIRFSNSQIICEVHQQILKLDTADTLLK